MYEPNVVGDWQEYEGHAGLRVRVHRLEPAEPPRGRDDAAEGLTYFRVRVTVENRGARQVTVHLEDGQIDVRIGPDGESAFLDWRNSQFIEGFDVYPLRRATAVLYAAGPERASTRSTCRCSCGWTRSGPTGGCGPADWDCPAGSAGPRPAPRARKGWRTR
ncbi:hypothetical protein SUDANB91_00668 [Streptomyces sp. SudanB91_2054]